MIGYRLAPAVISTVTYPHGKFFYRGERWVEGDCRGLGDGVSEYFIDSGAAPKDGLYRVFFGSPLQAVDLQNHFALCPLDLHNHYRSLIGTKLLPTRPTTGLEPGSDEVDIALPFLEATVILCGITPP
jgi:hypothetical protein